MVNLSVFIEIKGCSCLVGNITGADHLDARFSYADTYLSDPEHRAISLSLPLEEKTFNPQRTKNFFEGLLPEGFSRKAVAQSMQLDENDYTSILAGLGKECIGAIKIIDENDQALTPEYRRLSSKEVYDLAKEGATESAELVTKAHLSLTGASGKVGLYYSEPEKRWYLPIGDAPSTHIVKQSHVRLERIVQNEQLCQMTARKLGIDTPESFILAMDSDDEEIVLLATQRYDRNFKTGSRCISGMIAPCRLHQEDFAQAMGIASSDKYEKGNAGYMRKMFDILRSHSADPMADSLKLWDICVFNYLVGNTDNHIKNLSLLYSEDLKTLRLAPAYDIVSTKIYKSGTDNMSLSIGGVYRLCEITRDCFAKEAANIGLGTKMALRRFDNMAAGFKDALISAGNELVAMGVKQVDEISERILSSGGISRYL